MQQRRGRAATLSRARIAETPTIGTPDRAYGFPGAGVKRQTAGLRRSDARGEAAELNDDGGREDMARANCTRVATVRVGHTGGSGPGQPRERGPYGVGT